MARNSSRIERYCCATKKVAEVLEGLREEHRRLLLELAGVERAITALLERTPAPSAPPHTPPAEAAVPGPYAVGSLYEAVAAYLSAAGEPRTAREIAEALQAGGYPTRAASAK